MAALISMIDAQLVERVLRMNAGVKRLNVSHNAISGVDGEDTLQRLQSLVYLNLSYNKLASLDSRWAALANLQVFDASHNQITDISGLHLLVHLRRLDLSHNLLSRWDAIERLGTGGGVEEEDASGAEGGGTGRPPPSTGLCALESIHLVGNPLCDSLPGEQYEAYVRSLFPHLQRVDDTAERGRSRAPGSVHSASSGRTLQLHGQDAGVSDGHSYSARSVSRLSSSRPDSVVRDFEGGGEGASPRLVSPPSGPLPPAVPPSRAGDGSSVSTGVGGVPLYDQMQEQQVHPVTLASAPLRSSSPVPLTPARPPSLPSASAPHVAPAMERGVPSTAPSPGRPAPAPSVAVFTSKPARAPPWVPPPAPPFAAYPSSVSVSRLAQTHDPFSASQIVALSAQVSALQSQLTLSRSETAAAQAEGRQAHRAADAATERAAASAASAERATGKVAALQGELVSGTAAVAALKAKLQAQADVLDDYERTLSEAYASQVSMSTGTSLDGALDPAQEKAAHAEAYGHSLAGLRVKLTESLVALHSAEPAQRGDGDDGSDGSGGLSSDDDGSAGSQSATSKERGVAFLEALLIEVQAARDRAQDAYTQLQAASDARHGVDMTSISGLQAQVTALQAELDASSLTASTAATTVMARLSSLQSEYDGLRLRLVSLTAERDRAVSALAVAEATAVEARALVSESHTRQASEAARLARQAAAMHTEGDHRLEATLAELGQARLEAWGAKQDLQTVTGRLASEEGRVAMLEVKLVELQGAAGEARSACAAARMRESTALAQLSALTGVVRGDLPAGLSDVLAKMHSFRLFSEDALAVMSVRLHLAQERVAALSVSVAADAGLLSDAVDAVTDERNLWAESLALQSSRLAAENDTACQVASHKAIVATLEATRGCTATRDGRQRGVESGSSSSEGEGPLRRRVPATRAVHDFDLSAAVSELHACEGRHTALAAQNEALVQACGAALAAACDRTDAALSALREQGAWEDGGVYDQAHGAVVPTRNDAQLHYTGAQPSSRRYSSASSSAHPSLSPSAVSGGGHQHALVPGLASDAGALTSSASPSMAALSLLDSRVLRQQLHDALTDRQHLSASLSQALRGAAAADGAHSTAMHARLLTAQRDLLHAVAEREAAVKEVELARSEVAREKAALQEASRRGEEVRSRQVSLAKDSALRAKAAASNLEAALTTARAEAASNAADVRRLERELVRGVERAEADHTRLVDELSTKLGAAQAEVIRAREQAEDAQRRLDSRGSDLGRLQEQVAGLKRERNALIAALGQGAGLPVSALSGGGGGGGGGGTLGEGYTRTQPAPL